MSQWNEGDVVRDPKGQFASKGPAAEDTSVDLSPRGHGPLDEMEPRDAYATMVRELAVYDPDLVRSRYGIGLPADHLALRQAAEDPSSPEDDEYLAECAHQIIESEPNIDATEQGRNLRAALAGFDESRDSSELARASGEYLDHLEYVEPVDPDEAEQVARQDWDEAEDEGSEPALADRFGEVTMANPYTRISNDDDEAVVVGQGACGDNSVAEEYSVRRTWATGDPDKPFLSVTPTYYVTASVEEPDDWDAHAAWTKAQREIAEKEGYRSLIQDSLGNQYQAEDREVASRQADLSRMAELDEQIAAARAVPRPAMSFREVDVDEMDEHLAARERAVEAREQARGIERGLVHLSSRPNDYVSARSEMDRLNRYADGLEDEHPPVRFAVKSQTEFIAYTSEGDPGGSEVSSDYEYDDDSPMWINSLDEAKAQAERKARTFDFNMFVSSRNAMDQLR